MPVKFCICPFDLSISPADVEKILMQIWSIVVSDIWLIDCNKLCALQVLVRNVDDKLVMKVVLPQLMKLARDAEM